MSRNITCTAQIKAITINLFFGSKLCYRSFQYVTMRKPVDVIAEYIMNAHCSESMGKAHMKAVTKKLVNEYPYMPITSISDEPPKKSAPKNFMSTFRAKGSPNPIL